MLTIDYRCGYEILPGDEVWNNVWSGKRRSKKGPISTIFANVAVIIDRNDSCETVSHLGIASELDDAGTDVFPGARDNA